MTLTPHQSRATDHRTGKVHMNHCGTSRSHSNTRATEFKEDAALDVSEIRRDFPILNLRRI
ncbi:MAG: hypothetical protein K2Z81_26700, partial [Cyanobacteria bacterium]|nr:hypothetical protein [Cyanobacteriota bacterium]